MRSLPFMRAPSQDEERRARDELFAVLDSVPKEYLEQSPKDPGEESKTLASRQPLAMRTWGRRGSRGRFRGRNRAFGRGRGRGPAVITSDLTAQESSGKGAGGKDNDSNTPAPTKAITKAIRRGPMTRVAWSSSFSGGGGNGDSANLRRQRLLNFFAGKQKEGLASGNTEKAGPASAATKPTSGTDTLVAATEMLTLNGGPKKSRGGGRGRGRRGSRGRRSGHKLTDSAANCTQNGDSIEIAPTIAVVPVSRTPQPVGVTGAVTPAKDISGRSDEPNHRVSRGGKSKPGRGRGRGRGRRRRR